MPKSHTATRKRDIALTLADRFDVSDALAQRVIQGVFDELIDTLVKKGKIELRDFGVFKVKSRKPRKARNPRTGEAIWVPQRKAVRFKAGRGMLKKIQSYKG